MNFWPEVFSVCPASSCLFAEYEVPRIHVATYTTTCNHKGLRKAAYSAAIVAEVGGYVGRESPERTVIKVCSTDANKIVHFHDALVAGYPYDPTTVERKDDTCTPTAPLTQECLSFKYIPLSNSLKVSASGAVSEDLSMKSLRIIAGDSPSDDDEVFPANRIVCRTDRVTYMMGSARSHYSRFSGSADSRSAKSLELASLNLTVRRRADYAIISQRETSR